MELLPKASLRPEIEEVVPLKRRKLGEIRKAPRIASGVFGDRRVARHAARQLDPLGEALEMKPVAGFLTEAEQEIDRTAEQMSEDVRTGREGGRHAEERDPAHPA